MDHRKNKNDGEKEEEFLVQNSAPTLESPSAVAVAEHSKHQSTVIVSGSLPPNQEGKQSITSEMHGTAEAKNTAGQMQDLQSHRNISSKGFDASVSSSSGNQSEPEHAENGKCGQSEERESDLKEQDSHLPKGCKWSFQVSDLQNLSSTERITVLQAKMQEIRKRYRVLKAELAAIDRTKRLKKKKELERAAATSSSSANGMPGECRKQKCGPALMQHLSKQS